MTAMTGEQLEQAADLEYAEPEGQCCGDCELFCHILMPGNYFCREPGVCSLDVGGGEEVSLIDGADWRLNSCPYYECP